MQEQNDVHSSNADALASKFLGKRVGVCNSYDASLLVAVPRNENRIRYEIDANTFNGFDVWHAYEFSTMTKNGVPLTKLLKIKYSAQSEFIIESKSLKLYLNSFNMMRFENSVSETLNHCKKIIENDLNKGVIFLCTRNESIKNYCYEYLKGNDEFDVRDCFYKDSNCIFIFRIFKFFNEKITIFFSI